MSLSPATAIQPSKLGGKGLLATTTIQAGMLILSLQRPLIGIPDGSRITDTCSWCFAWTDLPILPGTGVNATSPTAVNWCTGCRSVKYCSKKCQSAAWKKQHKRECKILAQHRDKDLPTAVKAAVQILLGLRDDEPRFREVRDLVSHREDFEKAGGQRWKAMQLMAQTARMVVGESEGSANEAASHVICILLCNSARLVTPTFDPLGLSFDPAAARINHSCAPNAIVVYDGPSWTLRALSEIKAGEEVLISYIDETSPKGVRQAELKEQFFFHCGCKKCSRGEEPKETAFLTPGADFESRIAPIDALISQLTTDPAWARHDQGPSTHEKRLTALQFYAYSFLDSPDDDNPEKTTQKRPTRDLRKALSIIRNTTVYPRARSPMGQLQAQHATRNLAAKRYNEALIALLRLRFEVDIVVYESNLAHPVRVVHGWTLATLARAVAAEPETPFCRALAQCGVDLSVFSLGLLQEVRENVGKSHGVESMFGRTVEEAWVCLMGPGGEVETEFVALGVAPGRWRAVLAERIREVMPRVEAFVKDEAMAAQLDEAMAG